MILFIRKVILCAMSFNILHKCGIKKTCKGNPETYRIVFLQITIIIVHTRESWADPGKPIKA
jgi:hypothetical protein